MFLTYKKLKNIFALTKTANS